MIHVQELKYARTSKLTMLVTFKAYARRLSTNGESSSSQIRGTADA